MKYNAKTLHLLILMSALFLSLVGYLTYFQLVKAPTLSKSSQNPRVADYENLILRGEITDRAGEVLAYSKMEGGNQIRVYPHKSLYSHVIGYNNKIYGKSMLEQSFNDYLSGSSLAATVLGLPQRLAGAKPTGANLELTLSHKLQSRAAALLGKRRGAIAAIEPSTGKILALVSKPDFDPNADSLAAEWTALSQSSESPLLPRAVMGKYPPGSSFKPVIAALALEQGFGDEVFDDTGTYVFDGRTIKNYGGKAYGEIGLKKAFSLSSNFVFLTLAERFDEGRMRDIGARFLLDKTIPFDMPLSKSTLFGEKAPARYEVTLAGIGQGKVLVTPFQMALIAAAVANDGVIMRPYIVSSSKLSSDTTVYSRRPEQLSRAVDGAIAESVGEMMVECVKSGTGKGARVSGISVAGKTGTAENEHKNAEHSWFIAYAPADEPKIALAVILENTGLTGGEACAPIVRDLIRVWLSN